MKAEPTIRQLRHFLSLAEHCHFSRAAEACLITQSSLSASIRELELLLDTTLFERSNRHVLLTPMGQTLIPAAREVILSLDGLTDLARGNDAPLSGDLLMGVIPTIGPFLLPRVLPGLRKEYPDLRLYLREEHSTSILKQLAIGKLDVALIALPFETGNLETYAFAKDPFLAVFPRRHPLSKFETMTPTRLKNADLLTLESGNCLTAQTQAMGVGVGLGDKKSESAVEDAGHYQPHQFQATSLHTLVQMVENGLGLAVLPKMAVDGGILRGLRLDFRPFSSPGATRNIALAWRKTSKRGDDFRLLGNFMRDELGTPLR